LSRGFAPAEKFVAIGTSVSMGWASNGVYAGSQLTSWPELLAFGSLHAISLPLIQSPGCTSPLVAPLGAGKRLSGESLAGSTICAPNVAGVTLPTQNVALAAAIAADAVATTPEAVAATYPWFSRVLPPGTTQLSAALSQHPTLVSVELGGNEVLNGTSGFVAPGVTVVPLPFFIAPYDALLDALGAAGPKAVLVGLPREATNLAALRRADEIWADRAEFAALHVDVDPSCATSPNYINVSVLSLNVVFAGAQAAALGQPNIVYGCEDHPGTQDLVLTPADVVVLNTMLGQIDDHIRQQASARGYAYFSLGALYERSDLKPATYSVAAQLASQFPYGLYTSLDGVHPNAVGSGVLAIAAAQAINARYGSTRVTTVSSAHGALLDRMVEPEAPATLLERARTIAAQRRGERLPACPFCRQ
jgi:lysophospholipase L1-like esterase